MEDGDLQALNYERLTTFKAAPIYKPPSDSQRPNAERRPVEVSLKRPAINDHNFLLGGKDFTVSYDNRLEHAKTIIEDTIRKCAIILPPSQNDIRIEVTITDEAFVKSKMGGTTGFAPDGKTMKIGVNIGAKNWRQTLVRTVAHEYNHIIRFQNFPEHPTLAKGTVIDQLAFEGLAQCFEVEIFGKASPWALALKGNSIKQAWEKIKPHLNETGMYRKVFHDRESKEFPHWAGYSVGYNMVKGKLSQGIGWDQIMGLPSSALISDVLL